MPRITELPALAQATSGDVIPIVDDAGNITKKVTANKVVPDGSIVAGQLASNAVTTAKIADAQVTAPKIAAGAICLGYAQSTVDTATTSQTSISACTLTVTIPSGGRRVKITGYVPAAYNETNNSGFVLSIWDGAVGTGTQLSSATHEKITPVSAHVIEAIAVTTPSAGTKTYNLGWAPVSGGTAHTNGSSAAPVFILVELI